MKKLLCMILIAALATMCAGAVMGEALFVDNRETDKVYPERLNLRAEPSRGGGIIGLYYTGAQVEALGTEDDYTKVSIGGVTGYMASDYLITAEEAVRRYGEDSAFGTCRAAKVDLGGLWEASLSVQETTDKSSPVLASLRTGDMVELVGILDDDWAYIRAKAGEEEVLGYVPLNTLVDVAVFEAMIVAGSSADTRTILYSAPSNRGKEMLSLKNGTACFAAFGRKEGNWVKVRVGGMTGWIRYTQADNLHEIGADTARSIVPYYPLVMQTRTDALLHSVRGDSSSPYMTLGKDMKVEVLAEDEEYVYVRTMEGGAGAFHSGDYGFILISDLTLSEAAGGMGIVQADDGDLPVLIMSKPEEGAELVGALIPGAQVNVTDFTQSDYLRIALGDTEGYVLKSQIRALGDGSVQPSERIPQRATMLEDAALLNSPAGSESVSVSKGDRVYMLAVCGEYAYVQADAEPGFAGGDVRMGFVALSKLNAPAS
ncbi:MAG: SH3 domain-containing protein, partial [Clostridia bacterium]|nr:SH3 domain-containing protein [Clostridia bacterium]